ncbi:MAG: alpha/beta hydrolase fold domain-containing protein [Pseudoxanthomonas sp.]
MRLDRIGQAVWCAAALALSPWAGAQQPAPADGSVPLNGVPVPFSAFASAQARAYFARQQAERATSSPGDDIVQWRAFYDRQNSDRVERMRKLWPVRTYEQRFDGVLADVAEPAGGIAKANARRVLINLHGGAFLWGARSGALAEAIPIAAVGKVKVVSVDYRQGPEYTFPAASDDVETVYRALLREYRPENIGIYGCSAGGYLTAESVARLIHDRLPLPSAIGTFCGSMVGPDGDSIYAAAALNGDKVPDGPRRLSEYPYFKGADVADPLVLPGNRPDYVAKFPPTLLISGSRDFALSSVLRSHALLDAAGVDAELHVWEGMWHAFFVDPELPESQQAYAVIWRFFDRHLGARPARR